MIRNKIHSYHFGDEEVKIINFSLVQCNKDDFSETIYERNFYKARIELENNFIYCTKTDDPIFLQGTRDSKVAKKSHAYIFYDVVRCTNATRTDEDPECADEAAIDKWTKYK